MSWLSTVAVADNLPRVSPEKLEKLQNVIKKIFGQIGTIREGMRLSVARLLRALNTNACRG